MSNDTLANAAQMLKLQEQIAELQAQNARLTAQANTKVTVKPGTDKDTGSLTGSVSVYGLQKFPVSLYPEQWAKVFAVMDIIKAECARSDVQQAAANTKAAKKAFAQTQS